MSRILITPVGADEQEPALSLLFSDIPNDRRHLHVKRALEVFASGEVDPAHLLVARLSPQGPPVASMFAQLLPGASAMIWPPRTENILERLETEKTLVRTLLLRLRSHGVKLVQAFLSLEDREGTASLTRNGFQSITRIWHMRRDRVLHVDTGSPAADLDFIPFAQCDCAKFQETLIETYESSLDCPELNGLRTLDEVILGFRKSAPDLSRWWLLSKEGEAVGVLLLADGGQTNTWDVGYLGIAPSARRKGYSKAAMRFAIEQSITAKQQALTLIVDQRNDPAIKLYQSFDFKVVDMREVYLLFGLQG